MANPQSENFLKIPAKLAQVIAKTRFSAYESRVFWCILIKTCGWNKQTDCISRSQFAAVTGISPRHVCEVLGLLLKKQIITVAGSAQKKEYGIQTDYALWQNIGRNHSGTAPRGGSKSAPDGEQVDDVHLLPAAAEPAPNGGITCPNRGTKPAPRGVHTIEESIIQKNMTKEDDGGGLKKPFKIYQAELRERFQDLDFNLELEKFNLYWYGGARKVKNPHLALLNWLSKARQIAQNKGGKENGITGQHRQAHSAGDTAGLEAWNN